MSANLLCCIQLQVFQRLAENIIDFFNVKIRQTELTEAGSLPDLIRRSSRCKPSLGILDLCFDIRIGFYFAEVRDIERSPRGRWDCVTFFAQVRVVGLDLGDKRLKLSVERYAFSAEYQFMEVLPVCRA